MQKASGVQHPSLICQCSHKPLSIPFPQAEKKRQPQAEMQRKRKHCIGLKQFLTLSWCLMQYMCLVLSVSCNVCDPLSTDLLFTSAADCFILLNQYVVVLLFIYFSMLAMHIESSCMVNVNISFKPIINLSYSVLRGK